MAKEVILVPKLKYERLLKTLDPVEEQSTQDTPVREIKQTLKQIPDQQQKGSGLAETSTGYVSKKIKIGIPPGISNVRRKRKNIPWLTY